MVQASVDIRGIILVRLLIFLDRALKLLLILPSCFL